MEAPRARRKLKASAVTVSLMRRGMGRPERRRKTSTEMSEGGQRGGRGGDRGGRVGERDGV